MTTLAIIGGGIAARSLIYSLAKKENRYSRILLFQADHFFTPCSLNTTAIVAQRGLSPGHSDLGDKLLNGFKTFSEHVAADAPLGVHKLRQATGAYTKLDNFKNRYPNGKMEKRLGALSFLRETYIAQEGAFKIEPSIYLGWLLHEAKKKLPLEAIDDLVKEVSPGSKIGIKTHNGLDFSTDQIVFACGAYNRQWQSLFPESKLQTTKAVQGSYLEFKKIDWDIPSFSLTLEGDNLIYLKEKNELLLGSTTQEVSHELAPLVELKEIHNRLSSSLELELPTVAEGKIKVGLREKAQKREPFVLNVGNMWAIGGLYKNGFTLSLSLAEELIPRLKA